MPEKTKEEEKKEILQKREEILKEYGQESNIPINHEYWTLGNKYRSL